MKEKEDEEDDEEEILYTKIIFLNEKFDLQISPEYNSFIKNICNLFKIPLEQYNSLKISYKDEDDDNIILSTKEDFMLYFEQVKEKTVNGLILEIKEDSNIDEIACLNNALNHQNQIDKTNNKSINENNNMINDNNNFDNNIIKYNFENNNIDKNYINNNIANIEIDNDNIKYNFDDFNLNNNNINNEINNNIINNYFNDNLKNNEIDNDNVNDNIKYNFNNFNKNNNQNKDPIDNDAPIDDIIFDYKCSSCSTYPILFTLNYYPNCQFHICEDCIKKYEYHEHPLQKYVSRKELIKLKLKENFNIDNNNQIKDNPIKDNQKKENYPIKNEIYNNEELKLLEIIKKNPNPFKLLTNVKMKKLIKKHFKSVKNFFRNIPYGWMILKARFEYNLDGVDDNKLIEALKQTNGNIEEAIVLLTK